MLMRANWSPHARSMPAKAAPVAPRLDLSANLVAQKERASLIFTINIRKRFRTRSQAPARRSSSPRSAVRRNERNGMLCIGDGMGIGAPRNAVPGRRANPRAPRDVAYLNLIQQIVPLHSFVRMAENC
jgi:hypothetical protein